MALAMAEQPLRPVTIDVHEQLLSKYSFKPVKRQVVELCMESCISDRVTLKLQNLNFTNLLYFELNNCYNMVIDKSDFTTSVRLRIIMFYNSTIAAMQPGTFINLPHLQIVSLEALPETERFYPFEPVFQKFLQKLHCACEFAWYRSWWTNNKNLRLRVDRGELYSFGGPYNDSYLESGDYKKEELYYPVDCHVDPFPRSVEWMDYHAQTAYSVNEPECPETYAANAAVKVATEAPTGKVRSNSTSKAKRFALTTKKITGYTVKHSH
ncbi:uncharacterized protein LOC129589605 [Paramacrobiotus metropolitanus]|uniref:uncharacterized protein LOC129589605 n=1 Tax=Paramacrobiotus metropolitanus TaxID=2943436 RepID=UPI002445FE0C|nr:uncharacterized protein LOC129589605 [Paramacrobiotus metropolitanus]